MRTYAHKEQPSDIDKKRKWISRKIYFLYGYIARTLSSINNNMIRLYLTRKHIDIIKQNSKF